MPPLPDRAAHHLHLMPKYSPKRVDAAKQAGRVQGTMCLRRNAAAAA